MFSINYSSAAGFKLKKVLVCDPYCSWHFDLFPKLIFFQRISHRECVKLHFRARYLSASQFQNFVGEHPPRPLLRRLALSAGIGVSCLLHETSPLLP